MLVFEKNVVVRSTYVFLPCFMFSSLLHSCECGVALFIQAAAAAAAAEEEAEAPSAAGAKASSSGADRSKSAPRDGKKAAKGKEGKSAAPAKK